MSSIHLLGLTTEELEALAESLGQPTFRGKQISRWIYSANVESIADMSDLPAAFRDRLAEIAELRRSEVVAESRSPDGTAKFLLEFEDGTQIESVLLPYEDRVSVCVSTQVGCAVGCSFCATGTDGFCRNLSAGEMVDEVLTLQRRSARRISHVVYMGMGEPLLNYENVLKSIFLLTREGRISMRHITVSTVGVTPVIHKLAQERLQLTLAVSLHAPDDETRQRIIPLAARYTLHKLLDACREYAQETHRRITFEYLLLKDLNDSACMARKLADLLRGMLCNVNLIPYNGVEGLGLGRPPQAHIKSFRSVLEDAGITVTQRMERGYSISAACGQLRRREGGIIGSRDIHRHHEMPFM